MTKLYTVEEVAHMLRCKKGTVYSLVASDAIPHLRVGKLIRFEAQVIEKWVAAQMSTA